MKQVKTVTTTDILKGIKETLISIGKPTEKLSMNTYILKDYSWEEEEKITLREKLKKDFDIQFVPGTLPPYIKVCTLIRVIKKQMQVKRYA